MKATHTPTGQIVEAVQWKKTNFKEVWNLTNGQVQQLKDDTLGLRINGSLRPIAVGEYVIKTIDGQLHVHSERYFEGLYKEKCDLSTDGIPMK